MSKHKNYGGYFKPKKEEPINELNTSPEEVQTTEEAVETPQEDPEIKALEKEVEAPGPILAKVVNAKRVNMRADITKVAPIITTLSEGEEVEILEYSSDKNWAKIEYKSNTGFMMSQFLKEI